MTLQNELGSIGLCLDQTKVDCQVALNGGFL